RARGGRPRRGDGPSLRRSAEGPGAEEPDVKRDVMLSVVIPAFNEAANLEPVVQETLTVLSADPAVTSFELIVVDDGSRDGTRQIADRLASQHAEVVAIHHDVNRGFGGALRSGFSASRGDLVSAISADGEL